MFEIPIKPRKPHVYARGREFRNKLFETGQSDNGIYTPEQVQAFNRQHDQRYGWSSKWPNCYFNYGRLPETVVGELNWGLDNQPELV